MSQAGGTTMRAAVLRGRLSISVEDVARPAVKAGTILIRVRACGVCGSDLRIYESGNPRVKYPAVTGHEISGEIVEIGAGVSGWKVGDRVALGADVPCGECSWCKAGQGNCCDTNLAIGYQFAGGFAEYCLLEPLVVSGGPLVRVPDNVSHEEAALAEPLGCCINGMERAGMSKGKSVLIIGGGPVGTMLLSLAKHFGARWTALADRSEARLETVKAWKPDVLIASANADLSSVVMDRTKGLGVDVIFVACSSAEAQEQAVTLLAKRGVVNFFGGLAMNAPPISASSNILHYKEASLTGSHGSTPRQHAMAMKLIGEGKVKVKNLISHRFPLADIVRAFDTVKSQQGMKAVVIP